MSDNLLIYNISTNVEAFSTKVNHPLDFDVVLPLHQAHSAKVVRIPEEMELREGVDALITNRRGVCIGVKTADCVPILLYDKSIQAVAAIHSGWKGTLQNIISATIERMQAEYGTNAADLSAVIGPCIHQTAYEVGDELYELFAAAGYASYLKRMQHVDFPQSDVTKWHLDLPGICEYQLRECGVAEVQESGICTYLNHDTYYSARHLGKNFTTQRILTCIKLL